MRHQPHSAHVLKEGESSEALCISRLIQGAGAVVLLADNKALFKAVTVLLHSAFSFKVHDKASSRQALGQDLHQAPPRRTAHVRAIPQFQSNTCGWVLEHKIHFPGTKDKKIQPPVIQAAVLGL